MCHITGTPAEVKPCHEGRPSGDLDAHRMFYDAEPDFVETNCHWMDCKLEFNTQEELVRVSESRGQRKTRSKVND